MKKKLEDGLVLNTKKDETLWEFNVPGFMTNRIRSDLKRAVDGTLYVYHHSDCENETIDTWSVSVKGFMDYHNIILEEEIEKMKARKNESEFEKIYEQLKKNNCHNTSKAKIEEVYNLFVELDKLTDGIYKQVFATDLYTLDSCLYCSFLEEYYQAKKTGQRRG